MEKSNSGMHGHGMPIETKPIKRKPLQPNDSEMPTGETTTTTIHESKHFPFQIVEITTSDNKDPMPYEEKQFKIGMLGEFVSHKVFKTKETAEKYISTRPWELITNLVCLTFKNAFEYEKSKS